MVVVEIIFPCFQFYLYIYIYYPTYPAIVFNLPRIWDMLDISTFYITKYYFKGVSWEVLVFDYMEWFGLDLPEHLGLKLSKRKENMIIRAIRFEGMELLFTKLCI